MLHSRLIKQAPAIHIKANSTNLDFNPHYTEYPKSCTALQRIFRNSLIVPNWRGHNLLGEAVTSTIRCPNRRPDTSLQPDQYQMHSYLKWKYLIHYGWNNIESPSFRNKIHTKLSTKLIPRILRQPYLSKVPPSKWHDDIQPSSDRQFDLHQRVSIYTCCKVALILKLTHILPLSCPWMEYNIHLTITQNGLVVSKWDQLDHARKTLKVYSATPFSQ